MTGNLWGGTYLEIVSMDGRKRSLLHQVQFLGGKKLNKKHCLFNRVCQEFSHEFLMSDGEEKSLECGEWDDIECNNCSFAAK